MRHLENFGERIPGESGNDRRPSLTIVLGVF